jgi:predicted O-methyltransferase YrrM
MPDERTLAYVRQLFAVEDAALQAARARHQSAGLPAIHISPEEGKLLSVLLHAVGARRVLELGTLGGYSGVWLARALPEGGRLTTIECDPTHAAAAREAFADAGGSDRIDLHEGDAREILTTLEPGFDAVFVDADKEPMADYYHEGMRLLRVGGVLLGDNATYHDRVADPEDDAPDVRGVREFNALASTDERLAATIVPIRDGLLVGIKLAP